MNKPLKATMVFLCATLLAVLLISGSYICLCEADAETPSGEIMAEPTVPTTIVTVPVLPIPTEPTEPFPTHGETGDIKWVVNDEKQLIISKNNVEENCSTGEWYETYIEYVPIYTLDSNQYTKIPIEKERILDTPWEKCDYNSVIIEEGVTEIGSCTFYCDKFDKIILPDSIKTIKKSAFGNVKTSDKFIFPSTLTDIGYGAFSNSKFDFGKVVLPKTLTNLGDYAFSGCSEMKSVDLSQTLVKDIKGYTFSDCRNLQSVKFPQQLESIGVKAFSNTNIKEYFILSKNVKIGYNSMGYYSQTGEPKETETKFIGYTESTAAEYASKMDKFTFEPLDDAKGDLNKDGLINTNDIQLLQNYLINKAGSDIITAERADVSEDDLINVFDLMVLKRIILKN